MKLKSYFSATVEAAVELARQELGEDALLVNARAAAPEARHLGAYEVVFGAADARPESAPAPRDVSGLFLEDLAEMRREIGRLSKCLGGARITEAPRGESDLCAHWIDGGLDPSLAQAAARGESLEMFFEVEATLGLPGAGCAVVALVGPPGVGKTTTLVKLAAQYGLNSRRPAQILSADVFRIAAADQLRSLAAILGIGCDVVEMPVALAQAIEEHRHKEFVFIDTPGFGRNELEDGADLARLIASHPGIDTHLVLSASMKSSDLARVIDAYEIFQPKKLLFTRLDETASFGALISEAARRGRPISFLATGQQIPDDLEPATKTRLIELATGPAEVARAAGAAA